MTIPDEDIDWDRVDDTVLALFQLTLHDETHAWKSADWDVLARLHEHGLIHNPVGKAKSIALTAKGLERSEAMFANLFKAG